MALRQICIKISAKASCGIRGSIRVVCRTFVETFCKRRLGCDLDIKSRRESRSTVDPMPITCCGSIYIAVIFRAKIDGVIYDTAIGSGIICCVIGSLQVALITIMCISGLKGYWVTLVVRFALYVEHESEQSAREVCAAY